RTDWTVSFTNHHLQQIKEAGEEGPVADHVRQDGGMFFKRILQRLPRAEPGRQVQAYLRPGEHPRDSPQTFHTAGSLAFGRAAAQREQAEFLFRCQAAEVWNKVRMSADHVAIGFKALEGHPLDHVTPLLARRSVGR